MDRPTFQDESGVSSRIIKALERSSRPLGRQEYEYLAGHPDFWRAAREGIVSLERPDANSYAIRAAGVIGQMLVGQYLIQIEEKIPGALDSLLSFAQDPSAHIVALPSFVREEGMVLSSFIERFLDLVDSYLLTGRRKTYVQSRTWGTMPRGRIDLLRTMALWATGRKDLVAFAVDELSARIPENQLIGLALDVADRIISLPRHRRLRSRVRTASILFEDTGYHTFLRSTPADIEGLHEAASVRMPALQQLWDLARVIVLHFGLSGLGGREGTPVSWFVNLETLFEDCLRRLVRVAAERSGFRATGWQEQPRYVFPRSKDYRAKPDVVLWRGETPVAVLDPKYKNPQTSPSGDDLYQLLIHAQAFSVCQAALIYPSQGFTAKNMGESMSRVRVWAFTVNVRNLAEDAATIVATLAGAVRV